MCDYPPLAAEDAAVPGHGQLARHSPLGEGEAASVILSGGGQGGGAGTAAEVNTVQYSQLHTT